jgi:hypothetical protein
MILPLYLHCYCWLWALLPGLLTVVVLLDSVLSKRGTFLVLVMLLGGLLALLCYQTFSWVGSNVGLFFWLELEPLRLLATGGLATGLFA